MSVQGYQEIIQGPLAQYVAASQQIGGDVATQSKMVEEAFNVQLEYLVNASKSAKPSAADNKDLILPTGQCIWKIQEFREKSRGSKYFNHLSAISESIPALSWVAVSPTPAPYVKEMKDAGQFYTNRVLKDWKEKDRKHMDWVKGWMQTMTDLQAFVKQHHTTGLVWGGFQTGTAQETPLPPQATMSVQGYQEIIQGPLARYVAVSQQIGGDVATHSKMVEEAFNVQLEHLVTASESAQPISEDNDLILPTGQCIWKIQEFREKTRGSKYFNHLSAISESIPALGWSAVSPAPAPYVKEMKDAGQFYTNRVLKDWKEKDRKHMDWVKEWIQTLTELQAFVKQHHTTGLVWGGKNIASSEAVCGTPPPSPPPPPAPGSDNDRSVLLSQIDQGGNITKSLKKVTSDMQTHKHTPLRQGPASIKVAQSSIQLGAKAGSDTDRSAFAQIDQGENVTKSVKKVTSVMQNTTLHQGPASFKAPQSSIQPGAKAGSDNDRSALFAQIGQGENVKKGLKKVTSDMQTHKNKTLRQGPAPFKAPQSSIQPGAKPPVDKPPSFVRDGKKWLIENQKDNHNLLVEGAEMNNVVYLYNCTNSTIVVKGKLNSITVDSCKKTTVVFDSLLSCIEFINCQSVQMQVIAKVPTISIDKTDGCQMYLSNESLEVEIVSSKCSEMNVLVPKPDGDYAEYPVPEQFKTTIVPGKGLNTIIVENKA